MANFPNTARHSAYDVVIIGGAIMGSSVAWWLSNDPDFDGRVLVVERDPSYETCSTAHTNSCIRQQFSQKLNVQISQFGAEFIKNFPVLMGGDARIPKLDIQNFGYLYLADNEDFANSLRHAQAIQAEAGAGTKLLSREEIAAAYPYYMLDDVILGSHNTVDEGYWDGGAVFEWFRRKAIEAGVEYISGEVAEIELATDGARVDAVVLADGARISAEKIVNAAGPRASQVAQMAGLTLPVEPRKRFTYVVSAARPVPGDLPLTIDPSGVHIRQDGPETYMIGCAPLEDVAVDPTDFHMDHGLWENHVWPTVATRIPQFEELRIVNEWVGHYAYNTLDQNAILGPHPEVPNFYFINGFSGHGLQQAPAMGRGLTEMLVHGKYTSLDMSDFAFERLSSTIAPEAENAVI